MTTPGPTIDLRSLLTSVRDQGVRPTCLAFALTGCHEVERANASAISRDLGEEVLFWGSRQFMGTDKKTEGISPSAAAQALQKWGQSEAILWPYDTRHIQDLVSYAPPADAIAVANCYKAQLSMIGTDPVIIKTYLDARRAVVLSIGLAKQFFRAARGWVDMPLPTDDLNTAKHAILIVGYDDDTARPDDGYFVFRNSWGDDWGDAGYGYLPYKYVTQCALNACVLAPL